MLDTAGIAFENDTGILVEALPLWSDGFEHPETFNNAAPIESIRREGVAL